MATLTQSTNMKSWSTGWEIRPLALPSHTETLLPTTLTEIVEGQSEEDDKPIFGSHLREAVGAIKRLLN